MKRYEMLEHSSELRFAVNGKTKEELFVNAVLAMENYMKPTDLLFKEEFFITIEIDSIDMNSLLVDFLSEVLAHGQIEKVIFTKISFKEFTNNHLRWKLSWFRQDSFDEDIKAVTYQDLDIKEIESKGERYFSTKLVFDI